ncbi:hypothetical protein Tco_1481368, partial [Tanacetum coccineum]
MVVEEGVPAELIRTGTVGSGETSLLTRRGSRYSSNIGVRNVGAGPVLSCTGAIGS